MFCFYVYFVPSFVTEMYFPELYDFYSFLQYTPIIIIMIIIIIIICILETVSVVWNQLYKIASIVYLSRV